MVSLCPTFKILVNEFVNDVCVLPSKRGSIVKLLPVDVIIGAEITVNVVGSGKVLFKFSVKV